MITSQKGVDLIKSHEGLKLSAYLDTGKVWTIGYGHTGKDVYRGMKISATQAEALLRGDLKEAEDAVNTLVKTIITQNQFDALVSFVFNVGVAAFKKSTLLKMLNLENYTDASGQFHRWNQDNGKILNGLILRRAAESKLFGNKI